ncbi:rust resistance kinase Lr10 [Malus sylvestris]|uniref:rust resistance kinase Lr10 n=1 Tax=Malus sylvestris TaxID=3752 RepID=UPI0021ABF5AB|nr:rust resistance kinase Lr10 [Malus sylvestris]
MLFSGLTRKLVATGTTLGSFVVLLLVVAAYRVNRSNRKEKESQLKIETFLEDYKAQKTSRYSYADIKRITNQFQDKLGQGAYGIVFKGKLSSECFVAIKVLNSSNGNGEDFIKEVGMMGSVRRRNFRRGMISWPTSTQLPWRSTPVEGCCRASAFLSGLVGQVSSGKS